MSLLSVIHAHDLGGYSDQKKIVAFSYKGKYEGLKETSTMPFTITDAVY